MATSESPVRFPGDEHLGRGVLVGPAGAVRAHPAVIVIPGASGITDGDQQVARRLAQEGFVSLVVDPYASIDEAELPSERTYEQMLPFFRALDDRSCMIDLDNAYQFLASLPGVRPDRIGVLGFCAAWPLMFACLKPQLRACVAFYNGLEFDADTRSDVSVQPLARIPNLWAPVLYHRGADDPYQAPGALAELRRLAELHGKSLELHDYPGCGHGFAEQGGAYAPEQADLAWRRTYAFLGSHLNA